jgi:hypothetical protein
VTQAVDERHLAVLEWFVIRARRVEEHSLAQDKKRMLEWASSTFTFSQAQDEPTASVRWHLPPEEPLDSLAARCRPFILNNDSVYWAKVTNAIGYFLRDQDAEDLAAHVQNQRSSWRKLDKDTPGDLGYQSQTGQDGQDLGELVGSKTLAYAWLYGDLVHADVASPDRIGEHDIDDRYRAGAILITRIALHVIATLNLVRAMQQRGFIELPGEIFTQRVTANPAAELTVSGAVAGPVDTPTADLAAALDAAREGAGD